MADKKLNMYKLFFFLSILFSTKTFSQCCFHSKIISIKIYKDSTFEKLDICKTEGVSLFNFYSKNVEKKFQNYDLYFLNNKQLDSISLVYSNFTFPLKTLLKYYKDVLIIDISIYLNSESISISTEFNSHIGGAIYRENHCNFCNKVEISSPKMNYNEKEKKFSVDDNKFLTEVINKNINLFFKK